MTGLVCMTGLGCMTGLVCMTGLGCMAGLVCMTGLSCMAALGCMAGPILTLFAQNGLENVTVDGIFCGYYHFMNFMIKRCSMN